MTTFNKYKRDAAIAEGFSSVSQINDLMNQLFKLKTGLTQPTESDYWNAIYASNGRSLNDRKRAALTNAGYTEDLQTAEFKYWKNYVAAGGGSNSLDFSDLNNSMYVPLYSVGGF